MSQNSKNILMCAPTFFDIEYEINPWMHVAEQPSDLTAEQQWQKLHDVYTGLGWNIQLIDPVKHLPDMVFATDCCLMINGLIMLSSFRYTERQPETAAFEEWFTSHGYTQIQKTKHLFEGGGDCMLWGDKIIAGYGFRSELESHKELQDYFGLEVLSVQIVDPFYYHLDTSLAPLSPDTVAFYPPAISSDSQAMLRKRVPNLIEATADEARGFGLNAVSDGTNIICSDASPSLLQKYRDAGFTVHPTPILEFRKSGGGVKCLTLELR
jgi:N-dimethylarginine dimethylaminohydrolase